MSADSTKIRITRCRGVAPYTIVEEDPEVCSRDLRLSTDHILPTMSPVIEKADKDRQPPSHDMTRRRDIEVGPTRRDLPMQAVRLLRGGKRQELSTEDSPVVIRLTASDIVTAAAANVAMSVVESMSALIFRVANL
jgi:hypothetical protein